MRLRAAERSASPVTRRRAAAPPRRRAGRKCANRSSIVSRPSIRPSKAGAFTRCVGRDRGRVALGEDQPGAQAAGAAAPRAVSRQRRALRLLARSCEVPSRASGNRLRRKAFSSSPPGSAAACDNARRIAAGGGASGLRLDQPGIDQDQRVEPGRLAEQSQARWRRRTGRSRSPARACGASARNAAAGRREIRAAAAKAGILAAAVADPAPVEAQAGKALFCQCLGEPFVHPVRADPGLAAAGDQQQPGRARPRIEARGELGALRSRSSEDDAFAAPFGGGRRRSRRRARPNCRARTAATGPALRASRRPAARRSPAAPSAASCTGAGLAASSAALQRVGRRIAGPFDAAGEARSHHVPRHRRAVDRHRRPRRPEG